jgi:cytochrome c oxidase subunit IV
LGREVRTSIFLLFTIFKAGLVAAFFMHLRRDSKYYSYVILFPATMLLFFILLTLAV